MQGITTTKDSEHQSQQCKAMNATSSCENTDDQVISLKGSQRAEVGGYDYQTDEVVLLNKAKKIVVDVMMSAIEALKFDRLYLPQEDYQRTPQHNIMVRLSSIMLEPSNMERDDINCTTDRMPLNSNGAELDQKEVSIQFQSPNNGINHDEGDITESIELHNLEEFLKREAENMFCQSEESGDFASKHDGAVINKPNVHIMQTECLIENESETANPNQTGSADGEANAYMASKNIQIEHESGSRPLKPVSTGKLVIKSQSASNETISAQVTPSLPK